jgi:hypothetical protein
MSPRRLPETPPLLGTLTARDILDELSTRNLKPSLGNRSGGAAAFNVLAMVAEFKAEHDGRQHCGGKNEPRYRNGAVDRWTPASDPLPNPPSRCEPQSGILAGVGRC